MQHVQQIYLIRHAQTDYNLRGIVQGRKVDSDINATGREQAAAFYRKYRDVNIEQVFTSNLKRTRQTVAPFLRRGIAFTALSGLDEISWGVEEGRKPDHAARQAFYEMLKNWKAGHLEECVEGGESPLEVQARARRAWHQIRRTTAERVLVCVHGRLLRILMCTITGVPLTEMDEFSHQNTCLYLLERKAGKLRLTREGDVSHLHGLK